MDAAFAIPSDKIVSQNGQLRSAGSGKKALPNAIDLSHHLNQLALHRTPNQLKELYKYMGVPGMVRWLFHA